MRNAALTLADHKRDEDISEEIKILSVITYILQ
jgi:hypothetical protein